MTRSRLASKIHSETTPEQRVKEVLRAMGHYFDLPEKEVKFYIRQLELSGKI